MGRADRGSEIVDPTMSQMGFIRVLLVALALCAGQAHAAAAPLDQKVLKQLETSVGKSAFVGQGKKLKVVPKVSFLFVFEEEEMLTRDVGQPGYQGWFDRGGWRQDNRFERLGQDGQDEQAAQGHFVGGQKHIWTPFIQAE